VYDRDRIGKEAMPSRTPVHYPDKRIVRSEQRPSHTICTEDSIHGLGITVHNARIIGEPGVSIKICPAVDQGSYAMENQVSAESIIVEYSLAGESHRN
jgi:hypothetical protein